MTCENVTTDLYLKNIGIDSRKTQSQNGTYLHAESNALIAKIANVNTIIALGSIHCTQLVSPCKECAKLNYSSGYKKKLVYRDLYIETHLN